MELPPPSREIRGKSAEFDGRRINTVQPLHQGESMLQNLWKEHQQQQAAQTHISDQQKMMPGQMTASGTILDENERKLQQMLEKYQSQVKLQQQRNPTPAQQKPSSRNNLHKIEKVASTVNRGCHPSAPQGRTMSHSQPCLIAITDRPPEYTPLPLMNHQYQRRSSGSGEQPPQDQLQASSNGLNNQRVPNNQKLVNSLREENFHLKRETEMLKKKVMKMQQIESAYERIEREYETLLREKERQESLEKSALNQMENHLKRLMSEKETLQERLEQNSGSMASYQHAQALEKINQLNMLLADLITQNKDLQACKDRQKMEIDAQTATLEEQRNHIAVLDKALSNAQDRLGKSNRAYEELTHMSENAKVLQRQLHETLLDKQARDEAHAAERAQWEMEITQLKMQLNKDPSLSGSLKRSSGVRLSTDTNDETLTRLKKTIYSKEERITQLERTVVELQRKQHEENDRKNNQMISLSENMEAKVRKLEEEKSEKDRRIAELIEEKERLSEIISGSDSRDRGDFYFARERDDDASRDLHRMEEIKQKIQERKRKGRVGTTGGLIGMAMDHARSNSGSLLPNGSPHSRTYDAPLYDPSILPDIPGITYTRPMDTNGNGLGVYTTTVAFRGDNHDEYAEPPAWKP